jgi:F-type H+-transporting ATPase subunit b
MESTLRDLGALLLKAIPTLVLLIVVYVYLRWMFFRPLEKVLAERKQATEGTRKQAEAVLAKASEIAATIEGELQKAREDIYREQEEARRKWLADQTAQLEQARQHSHELVHQARQQLEADTAAAKLDLAATADSLAEQITTMLLERKPA